MEWNRVADDHGNEYTFEMVLRENGNIVFQYQPMTYSGGPYYCQSSGIEDSLRLDGLTITPFCGQIASNHAILISRPAPAARVQVRPRYQGNLIRAGEIITFQIPIKNTGELGALFPFQTHHIIPPYKGSYLRIALRTAGTWWMPVCPWTGWPRSWGTRAWIQAGIYTIVSALDLQHEVENVVLV